MKKIFALFLTLVTSLTFLTANAPAAEAKAGDLVIRNSSSSKAALLVCKDWTGSNCAGSWYYLWPGKNTRDYFGWQDADAVKLVPSQKYYVSTNNWSVHNNCGGATVMEKRRGGVLADPAVETWTVYYC